MEELMRKTEEALERFGEDGFIMLLFRYDNERLVDVRFPGSGMPFPKAKEREEKGIYYRPTDTIRMKRYLELLMKDGLTKEELTVYHFKAKRPFI